MRMPPRYSLAILDAPALSGANTQSPQAQVRLPNVLTHDNFVLIARYLEGLLPRSI